MYMIQSFAHTDSHEMKMILLSNKLFTEFYYKKG